MYNLIVEHFPLFLSALGGVVWLIRLEGRQNMSEKDNARTQADVDAVRMDLEATRIELQAVNSKVLEKISQIQQTVARIEGMLEAKE